MSLDTFSFFAKFIEKELGIVYSDFNRYQLENRLEEVAKSFGCKDVAELHRQAQAGMPPMMKQLLLDTATNNETSFFRDPRLFKAFEQDILPAFAGRPLRLWSAACSSGQEVYSLGIIHLEKPVAASLEIVGTDIATHVLKRAEEGRYTQLEAQRGLSAVQIAKFFDKEKTDHYRAKPALSSMMRFHQLNLLGDLSSMDNFDVIFCRNVLIYQSVENKARVVEKLTRCLNPGGLLILGAGESLLGLSQAFTTIQTENAVYYKLGTGHAKRSA